MVKRRRRRRGSAASGFGRGLEVCGALGVEVYRECSQGNGDANASVWLPGGLS